MAEPNFGDRVITGQFPVEFRVALDPGSLVYQVAPSGMSMQAMFDRVMPDGFNVVSRRQAAEDLTHLRDCADNLMVIVPHSILAKALDRMADDLEAAIAKHDALGGAGA